MSTSDLIDTAKYTLAFRNIRDARAAAKKAWEAEDAKLEANKKLLQAGMLKFLNATNQEASSTEFGTFYKEEKVTPSAMDWDKVYEFIVENNAWELLQKRFGINFVKDYMEAHDKEPPPGVKVFREWVVKVRKN